MFLNFIKLFDVIFFKSLFIVNKYVRISLTKYTTKKKNSTVFRVSEQAPTRVVSTWWNNLFHYLPFVTHFRFSVSSPLFSPLFILPVPPLHRFYLIPPSVFLSRMFYLNRRWQSSQYISLSFSIRKRLTTHSKLTHETLDSAIRDIWTHNQWVNQEATRSDSLLARITIAVCK